VLKQLATFKHGIRILSLYGGEPIFYQIAALKKRPQIIVATPGRLMDHMDRRTTRLTHVNCVVLDEADRMLDMGFRDDITTILQSTPEERQTVLFSATISDEIKKIAKVHQNDAQQIHIEHEALDVGNIEQHYIQVRGNVKTQVLTKLLDEQKFKLCLVFVATKSMATSLAQQLNEAGYPADSIPGDLHQRQRNKVMQRYKDGKLSLLVATDVAARGIDVTGIDAVINYDIPGDSDSYVHRIGRTGRAKRKGVAYTFIYPKEYGRLQSIIKDTDSTISLAPIKFTQESKVTKAEAAEASKPKKRRSPYKKRRRSHK
jgi:ATP-dependent RNA helicase DeaD